MSGSAVQVLQQAEALKTSVSDAVTGSNEAWMKRQSLQDLYQQLLVMDLEYALDKKVEQDLWNHAFKNQINNLQNQAKDKSNPKRGEIQASLDLFLETASGFYIQLLQELCTAFKLDLPFRRKCSNYGIFKERSSNFKIKAPKKTSCMYICQHCLVHLGDIARYRQQIEQAQTYYRHAARLVPYNGQPYNQLAILEAAKGNKLSTVFYYIRSIAVRHPFPVASTNLEKFYVKISKETLDYKGKLSVGEIVSSFLQFHAFIHLSTELDRAHRHIDRLMASLPSHFTSLSFSAYQLVQMVTINLFAMHHAHRKLEGEGANNKGGEVQEPLSKDEQKCYEQVFNLTVSLLDALLHYTPKQESKAKDYHTLPALKIILDWLHTEDDILEKPVFKNSSIWANLCKLLSNLQSHLHSQDEDIDLEKYVSLPLPEDHDLQCFLSLQKFYSSLDFLKQPIDNIPPELEIRLRCHRLVQHGVWLADKFPSLNLVNYQKLNSGKLQFTIPTAQLRVLTGSETNHPPDRKSTRQNVAIQAIMQKSKKNMQSLSTAPKKKKVPTAALR